MPTYEYTCGQCGKFAYWQWITEALLPHCPICKSPVERLISGGGLILVKDKKIESPYYEDDQVLYKSK